jgi:hypothetical protein
MILNERFIFEMKQRSGFLREEISQWKEKAFMDEDQLGVHGSQITSLKNMMDGLLDRQQGLLSQLLPGLPAQQFAETCFRLTSEIVGTQDLWRIFRYIFDQIKDPHLGPLLDTANRVVEDSYIAFLNQAKSWGLVKENQFREPPLVYLEADFSPATVNRGAKVSSLSFPISKYGSLRLPIPIVIMPFDQVRLIWLLCTLLHEVGHNLDQALKLNAELKSTLSQTVDPERCEVWTSWTAEILADAIGVVSGGAGFGYALATLLYLLAPRWVTLNTTDSHPDHTLRLHLVAELIEQTGIAELKQAATEISKLSAALPVPVGAQAYLDECPAVAACFLNKPLNTLAGHSLKDLNPNLKNEAKQTAQLAIYLRTGSGFDEPTTPLPPRLVPASAELTLVEMENPSDEKLGKLHESALAYIKNLDRPKFLSIADNSEFLRQLVSAIDFTEETL